VGHEDAFSLVQITSVLTKEATDYSERKPRPKLQSVGALNVRRILRVETG